MAYWHGSANKIHLPYYATNSSSFIFTIWRWTKLDISRYHNHYKLIKLWWKRFHSYELDMVCNIMSIILLILKLGTLQILNILTKWFSSQHVYEKQTNTILQQVEHIIVSIPTRSAIYVRMYIHCLNSYEAYIRK